MAILGGNGGNFIGSEPTITANQTLTTTYNWMTVGPTTINSSVTVTINSGAIWVII